MKLRHLLLARKAMTNLEGILKSRHYFDSKCPYSQTYGFANSHVWMWELDRKEGWAPKNWCFQTAVLEKTPGSPLDCKEIAAAAAAKSLQSCSTLCDPIDGSPPGSPFPGILQARTLEWVAISVSNAWRLNPEYSLEGLMLKFWYFGHLMQTADLLEKTLMLGKGRKRRGWQRMRQLDGIIQSMDMGFSTLREILKDRKAWCAAVQEVAKSWTQLSDWTTTILE